MIMEPKMIGQDELAKKFTAKYFLYKTIKIKHK
jgi:hypothetical protein